MSAKTVTLNRLAVYLGIKVCEQKGIVQVHCVWRDDISIATTVSNPPAE
ncbi:MULTISPECIES: hypothetical protein [unclassified Mesorhizobium]